MNVFPVSNFPIEARFAAQRKIETLLTWERLKIPKLNGRPLVLSFPHRVFWISVRDLRESRPLFLTVDPRAWRFLVMSGDCVVAAVQVWNDRGTWRVSSVHTGATATQMETALAAADLEGSPPSEPCYIWCRAAWTAALWLRPWDLSHGQVVILPGKIAITETAFIDNLRDRATRKRL